MATDTAVVQNNKTSSNGKSDKTAPTVLIVDDGRVDRAVFRGALESSGFDVFESESAEGAWDFLRERSVDVVVSDLVMPGKSGLDLLQGMRAVAPNVPVVLVTASDRMTLAAEAVRNHAFDLLLKPVSLPDLVASVQAALEQKTRKRPGRASWVQPSGEDTSGTTAVAAILASLPSGLLVVDSAGLIRLVNPAAQTILGLTEKASAGLPYTAVSIPGELVSVIREALRGKLPDGQLVAEYRRDDGGKGWLGFSASSLRWPGDVSEHGVIIHFSDISEKMRMETSLIQADKLATLGTMASALAHDINNPMTVILGSLELLTEEVRTGDTRLADRLRLVTRSSWQCVDIVRNFLKLARSDKEGDSSCFVDDVLKDIASLLEGDFISRRIRLETKVADGVAPLPIGASKLQQVLMNLFVNARDAMPSGGTLTVRASMDAPRRVAIDVHDSGVGIPAEHLSQIFNTFFSTKAPGEGTGLGLSICRMLVREHGGELEVRSEVGAGTTFRVLLPAAHTVPLGSAVPSSTPLRAGTNLDLDVLVVDDEPTTLELYDRMLGRAGCRSKFYSRPGDALAEFKAGRFDLAVIDLRMPEMDGFELCRLLHRIEGTLPVLFVSGTVLPDLDQKIQECSAVGLLGKPFRIAELQSWLERIARVSPRRPGTRAPQAVPAPSSKRYRVLVIDDEPDMCMILSRSLEDSGTFDVETATSGEEGLRLAQKTPPTFVLLDLMMPDMDGFETCRRLKQDPRTRDARVVILSAMQELGDVVRALHMGADHFLMKPREIGGLARELLDMLDPADADQELPENKQGDVAR